MSAQPIISPDDLDLDLAIAREVRVWLARADLKQVDIAHMLQLPPSQITRRMKGHTPFTVKELALLSSRFGVTLGEFLGSVSTGRIIQETENPRSHQGNGDQSVRPAGVEPATNGSKVPPHLQTSPMRLLKFPSAEHAVPGT